MRHGNFFLVNGEYLKGRKEKVKLTIRSGPDRASRKRCLTGIATAKVLEKVQELSTGFLFGVERSSDGARDVENAREKAIFGARRG